MRFKAIADLRLHCRTLSDVVAGKQNVLLEAAKVLNPGTELMDIPAVYTMALHSGQRVS